MDSCIYVHKNTLLAAKGRCSHDSIIIQPVKCTLLLPPKYATIPGLQEGTYWMCSTAGCYSIFILIATLMGIDLFLEQSGSDSWCWLSMHAQWFPISLTTIPCWAYRFPFAEPESIKGPLSRLLTGFGKSVLNNSAVWLEYKFGYISGDYCSAILVVFSLCLSTKLKAWHISTYFNLPSLCTLLQYSHSLHTYVYNRHQGLLPLLLRTKNQARIENDLWCKVLQ